MKTITITIDAEGESHIDLQGFHGKGCEKVLAEFAGDDKAIEVTNKPEYAEQTVAETVKAKA